MNVGLLMSSSTMSAGVVAVGAISLGAGVLELIDVLVVAIGSFSVSSWYSSNIDCRVIRRSCLCIPPACTCLPASGATRSSCSPRAGYCRGFIIPGRQVIPGTHLVGFPSLLVERGEGPLQEIERTAELSQLLRRGGRKLRRQVIGQGSLDVCASSETMSVNARRNRRRSSGSSSRRTSSRFSRRSTTPVITAGVTCQRRASSPGEDAPCRMEWRAAYWRRLRPTSSRPLEREPSSTGVEQEAVPASLARGQWRQRDRWTSSHPPGGCGQRAAPCSTFIRIPLV